MTAALYVVCVWVDDSCTSCGVCGGGVSEILYYCLSLPDPVMTSTHQSVRSISYSRNS